MLMNSQIVLQQAKAMLALSGLEGTKGISPIDDNRLVASTPMNNDSYAILAQPIVPCLLSVKVTASDTADTIGTITFVGLDINGDALTEEVTPIVGETVYTTNEFASVTSITGADWVVDEVEGTVDNVIIGVADIIAPTGYYISAIHTISESVVARQTNVDSATVVELSDFTAIPANVIIPVKLTKIALTSGSAIAYLAKL